MKTSMAAAKVRVLILLLAVCAAAFAWETTRNTQMQPVTGRVIGEVYKGYSVAYKVQEQSYQFETRIGIVDSIGGLRSLPLNAAVPVLVNPDKPYVALINTVNGRYGLTLTFVSLLLLFAMVMLIVAIKRSD